MKQQQAAAPGWYPAGAVQRYWDGSQWTEHTAPLPPPQQAAYAAPVAPTRYVTTQRKNTWHGVHATLAVLTCGLWGLVWFIVYVINQFRPRRSVTRAR